MSKALSSPFTYRAAVICTDKLNKDGNITFKEINTLVSGGLLFQIDFEILKIVSAHRYISKAHLEWILCEMKEYQGVLKSETVKRRVKFLCTHGLLLRKYLQFRDLNLGIEDTVARAANFYEVTRGALAYLKRTGAYKVKDIETYLIQDDTASLFKRFAVNQLVSQFVKKGIPYEDIALSQFVHAGEGGFLRGLISPRTFVWATIRANTSDMEVYVEPVRRDAEWKNILEKRLESLQRLSRGESIRDGEYKVLFVTEDDAHMLEVSDLVSKNRFIEGKAAYTTDIALLGEDLSSSVFSVKKTDDGHVLEEMGNRLLLERY